MMMKMMILMNCFCGIVFYFYYLSFGHLGPITEDQGQLETQLIVLDSRQTYEKIYFYCQIFKKCKLHKFFSI